MTDTTTAPRRIQRRRTGGWRMPTVARYVGRGSRFGNPARIDVARDRDTGRRVGWSVCDPATGRYSSTHEDESEARAEAVALYRAWMERQPVFMAIVRRDLAGWDLACWCPEGSPCHADVLLEIANGGAR